MIYRLKRLFKGKEGMTLVEVIVSIALLGIIAAMVLVVFASSLLMAVNSGDNTSVTGDASTQMNKSIVESVPAGGESMTAVVRFKHQVSNSVDVSGQFITTQAISTKNESTMKSFVPD